MAGPFKLKGWSPFTKKSPAKTEGHGGAEDHTHPEVEVEGGEFEYEELLLKKDPKDLTNEDKRVLDKYSWRKERARKKAEKKKKNE